MRVVWPGVLLGIGLAGTLDGVILHQLLHWHHVYDRSTPTTGRIADGLFHAGSTVLLVLGSCWGLARLRSAGEGASSRAARRLYGSALIGLGGFNLYDGTVQHKIVRLHQIRYGEPHLWAYDAAFLGVAALLLIVGIRLLRGAETG